jgi:dephospho-CoA kinase
MLRVALTGGIATGKSYVLEQFRGLGVPCVDADEFAHGVTAAGTEATAAIALRFGADILAADGSVDRTKLARVVFADPQARRELEAIVHPPVYRAIAAALGAFGRLGYDIAVADIPLLFESGHEKEFDHVIVTSCPPELQLARLRERGMPDDEARRRIAAQWPTAEKTSRAGFVVRTDGSTQETDAQVAEILRYLRS